MATNGGQIRVQQKRNTSEMICCIQREHRLFLLTSEIYEKKS